tara:strand:+ start:10233 stop:10577 length:345 start_codon:yes stop_codon:yes gene_type:complete
MTTKQVKKDIIDNYIDWFTSDEDEREQMKENANLYVEEDHVDEIGQAFPVTVRSLRDVWVEKLGHFVSDDPEESYDKLVKQESIDGDVMADDVVLMWAPLVGVYTVTQLLDEIT